MSDETKIPSGRLGLQLVLQGYAVAAVVSTSGWDVLLLITFSLLGVVALREILRSALGLLESAPSAS